jgi:DNA polymerase-3 subunit delta'
VAEFKIPRLEKLNFQPEVQKLLLGLLDKRIVQTFLWMGAEGTGKKTYALGLVRSLFCNQGADCTGCPACKQVLNLTHPDLFWVHRDYFWSDKEKDDRKKQGIIVNTAKLLAGKISQAPFSAPLKVAVIPDAYQMNEDAQNVLLKTLEEPPAKSIIILLGEKTGDFLPTVLSRCRIIRFPLLASATIERLLTETRGWKKEEARKAALEAGGNMIQALREADPDWVSFREKVQSDLDRALTDPDEEWLSLVTEYDKWEPDFLEEREETPTQRKARVLRNILQVYITLWDRRLAGNAEIPKKLGSLPPGDVLKCLQKHQDLISTNLQARMILDHVFMELREGFQKGEMDNRTFTELSVEI